MKEKVICDTGVLSRYLSKQRTDIINTIDNYIGVENICITSANRIELLNWLSGYRDLIKTQRAFLKKYILSIPLLHINESISKIATEISEKNINSKPVDTFICATARYHNIKIYTIDDDFKQIKAPLY
ncbi:MAG: PIN domain-containing protein [Bacteroidota bacterium]|nr:PIN domain-containing protein [Bacteroidota bacterium]